MALKSQNAMCPDVTKSIFEEGVELRVVPQNKFPVQFFVSEDGNIGVKVYPNGRKARQVARYVTSPNQKNLRNAHRKQRYLQFRNAFGPHKAITTSHAVYLAWVGEIPEGMQIDHLNNITIDNRASNLDIVTNAENLRRSRYQHLLNKHCPAHAQTFTREDYLRFFAMPFEEFKAMIIHDFPLPTQKAEDIDKFMEREMSRHHEN